jgi:two-component system chemotaxis response regulator CheY
VKDCIRTLIVDDSRIQRQIINNLMTQLAGDFHFAVTSVEAENGKDAIAKLGTAEVDLVLLDWNMPLLSGLAFMRTIKKIERCRDLPVVMITAETSQKHIIEALKEGARDYIIKPIDIETFRRKLLNLIQAL